MAKLIAFVPHYNVPSAAIATFEHPEGFTLNYDINVPRGLSEAARQNAFAVELIKAGRKVDNLDVSAYRERCERISREIAADYAKGWSSD